MQTYSNRPKVFRKLDEGYDIAAYNDGGGTSGDCGKNGDIHSTDW